MVRSAAVRFRQATALRRSTNASKSLAFPLQAIGKLGITFLDCLGD